MALIWFNDGSQGILQHDLYPLTYYGYGQEYFGSYRGMRFRIARDPLVAVNLEPEEKRAEGATLVVTIWPEPLSFADTPEEKKVTKVFGYSEEELNKIGPYLNEYYQQHKDEWPEPSHAL